MNLNPWYIQTPIVLVPFVLLSAVFPAAAWFFVIAIFSGVEAVSGYHAPLVGEPGGVDLGAVLVTVLYLLMCGWSAYWLFQKKLHIGASIVGFGAILALPYIFSLVSSIIWF